MSQDQTAGDGAVPGVVRHGFRALFGGMSMPRSARALNRSEPRAAQIFGENSAHVAELAKFADDFEWEGLRLIPLHDVRQDFAFSELPNRFAKLELLGCVLEFNGYAP